MLNFFKPLAFKLQPQTEISIPKPKSPSQTPNPNPYIENVSILPTLPFVPLLLCHFYLCRFYPTPLAICHAMNLAGRY